MWANTFHDNLSLKINNCLVHVDNYSDDVVSSQRNKKNQAVSDGFSDGSVPFIGVKSIPTALRFK